MKRFGKLDSNNLITHIECVVDAEAVTEQNGIDFLRHVHKNNDNWVEIPNRAVEIGYTYDPSAKTFTPPQPFPSWTLDSNREWQAPVDYPSDTTGHTWNEADQTWD